MVKPRANRRLDAEALWQYALKALSARSHSSGELRQKLRTKAERVADVETTLSRLKDASYLNDRKFAEGFATARLENRGFGKSRVLQDLRQRRVAPAVAERTVQKLYQHVNEKELIEDFIRRKFRSAPREALFQDEKDLASAYRKLLRAGFSSGTVVRALKRFAKNPELLDGFELPEMEEENL